MRGDYLNVMMVRLMKLRRSIEFGIHGVELLVLLRNLFQNAFDLPHEGSVLHVRREVGNGFAEGQVIDAVGEVGHGCVEIVIDRLGLNVKVSRDAVDHQVSRHLTSGMFGSGVARIRSHARLVLRIGILLFPVFVLLFHVKLSFGVSLQCRNRSVHFVIGKDCLTSLVPAEGGEGHDTLIFAELCVDNTVDFTHTNRHTHLVNFLSELFPCRVKALAPDAPGSIHINESHLMRIQKLLESIRSQLHSLLPILMKLLQSLLMLLVRHLPLLPISSGENASLSTLIKLPLFDIFGNVLPIGSEGVPDIDAYKVAV
mmetsp:Transcript_45018/g.94420  ORF Transcript_45018/g.94420 Transcript_45018/m.94420 type:complete len:313 (-) Transcript_45018:450-1388(-)